MDGRSSASEREKNSEKARTSIERQRWMLRKMDDSLDSLVNSSLQVNGNRTDSGAKFSIFQMLDNSRRRRRSSNGAEQTAKTSCERQQPWCPASGRGAANGDRSAAANRFRTLDFASSTDALLEELTVFNSSRRPTAVERVLAAQAAAQATGEQAAERLLFRWLGGQIILRGGQNSSSQADGAGDAACDGAAYKNNIYNLRSEEKNEQRAAGELQRTVSAAVHRVEPFLKHLVDNDENTTYQCLLLNHQRFERSLCDRLCDRLCDQLCDPLREDASRISRFVDYPDDRSALITQTSEFVTIIRLDRPQWPSARYDLNCSRTSAESFSANAADSSSLEQLDANMYALSGVPNGLKNQTTAASTNYLPAGALLPNAPGPLLQHSTSMPSISAPIVSTSLVPVVVSATHLSPALPHQPILHQNVHFITEKVQIFRQPGERIGLALNFNEGSTNSDQKIERVFIQNVNPNSPASKAKGERLLGHLKENDELLCIENRPVNTLCRLDCVEILRDAGACITLLVRGARVDSSSLTRTSTTFEQTIGSSSSINGATLNRNAKRSPPQIPPRRETTVLSSVGAKDANPPNSSPKCDLNSSDKMNANNLKNSSSSTGTLRVLRRPVVAPPLPPPRKPITTANSSEDHSPPDKRPIEPALGPSNGSPCTRTGDTSELAVSASVCDESKANHSNGAPDSAEVCWPSDATSSSVAANKSSIVLSESNVLNERSAGVEKSASGGDHREEQLVAVNESSTMRAGEQTLNSINAEAPKQLVSSPPVSKCERAGERWSPVKGSDRTANEIKANQSDEPNHQAIGKLGASSSPAASHSASVQHQSGSKHGAAVSYAANIATSALQLMSGLSSPNHISGSPLQAASNHYLDLLNQRNVCIRIVLLRDRLESARIRIGSRFGFEERFSRKKICVLFEKV